jgi:hypothetical protein
MHSSVLECPVNGSVAFAHVDFALGDRGIIVVNVLLGDSNSSSSICKNPCDLLSISNPSILQVKENNLLVILLGAMLGAMCGSDVGSDGISG